jgi:hypothetical protein
MLVIIYFDVMILQVPLGLVQQGRVLTRPGVEKDIAARSTAARQPAFSARQP